MRPMDGKKVTPDTWYLNNVITEMKLNSEQYRKLFSLICPLADFVACVSCDESKHLL